MPRYVAASTDGNRAQRRALYGWKLVPELWWHLDNTKPLKIAVEVRFQIYIKGSGRFEFWPDPPNDEAGKFYFVVPQWDLDYYVEDVQVSISPSSAGLLPGMTQQFSASVHGASDEVVWSASRGSISSTGLYRAGRPGRDTVKATSVAHPSVYATARVFVDDPYL